jgi:hypothetical protein
MYQGGVWVYRFLSSLRLWHNGKFITLDKSFAILTAPFAVFQLLVWLLLLSRFISEVAV